MLSLCLSVGMVQCLFGWVQQMLLLWLALNPIGSQMWLFSFCRRPVSSLLCSRHSCSCYWCGSAGPLYHTHGAPGRSETCHSICALSCRSDFIPSQVISTYYSVAWPFCLTEPLNRTPCVNIIASSISLYKVFFVKINTFLQNVNFSVWSYMEHTHISILSCFHLPPNVFLSLFAFQTSPMQPLICVCLEFPLCSQRALLWESIQHKPWGSNWWHWQHKSFQLFSCTSSVETLLVEMLAMLQKDWRKAKALQAFTVASQKARSLSKRESKFKVVFC